MKESGFSSGQGMSTLQHFSKLFGACFLSYNNNNNNQESKLSRSQNFVSQILDNNSKQQVKSPSSIQQLVFQWERSSIPSSATNTRAEWKIRVSAFFLRFLCYILNRSTFWTALWSSISSFHLMQYSLLSTLITQLLSIFTVINFS